ncbi:hypothetical protein BBJ29_007916 [Phytophthora kernoviae]|uniref:RxLR effector protein n=1 Tax=Phytophthora kernoviae TaxID=325452 RepID=A0A3F2RNJ7_9STRA|nr:hypothetical protein BBJ29_007916 [Phytophthora kernoviae]RLN60755.1 hypothetical protein BBP00_00005794 [Phytophthora kernoviae]
MRVYFTVLAAAVTLIASTDASLAYTDSDQTKLSKVVSDFGIHSIESHQIEEKRFLRTHVDTSEEEDEDKNKNNEERAGTLNKLNDLTKAKIEVGISKIFWHRPNMRVCYILLATVVTSFASTNAVWVAADSGQISKIAAIEPIKATQTDGKRFLRTYDDAEDSDDEERVGNLSVLDDLTANAAMMNDFAFLQRTLSGWDTMGKNADDIANILRADKASDKVIDILPQIFTRYKQLKIDKAKEAAIALAKRAGTS